MNGRRYVISPTLTPAQVLAHLNANATIALTKAVTTTGAVTVGTTLTVNGSGPHAFAGVIDATEAVRINRASGDPYIAFQRAGVTAGYIRGTATGTVVVQDEAAAAHATFATAGITLSRAVTVSGSNSLTLSSGQLLIGDTSRTYGDVVAQAQLSGASAAGSAFAIFRHSSSGNASRLVMGCSRGAAGTATAVQANDVLTTYMIVGADGTNYASVGAELRCVVDAAVSTGIVPTSWRFYTRNSGGTLASRVEISSGGSLSVNTGNLTVSAGAVLATTTGTVHAFTLSDAATTSSPECVMFRHNTSGTPGAGFGQTVSFLGQSSTTTNQYQFAFQTIWADATHASRRARTIFNVYDTAAREAFRFEASGTAPMVGFLGASAVVRQTIGAAATDAATTQTLVNNIRTALINLGLCQN